MIVGIHRLIFCLFLCIYTAIQTQRARLLELDPIGEQNPYIPVLHPVISDSVGSEFSLMPQDGHPIRTWQTVYRLTHKFKYIYCVCPIYSKLTYLLCVFLRVMEYLHILIYL